VSEPCRVHQDSSVTHALDRRTPRLLQGCFCVAVYHPQKSPVNIGSSVCIFLGERQTVTVPG